DKQHHGANGIDTARSLSQLAYLLLREGKPGEALPLIEEAAAIDQHRLGGTHPFIADDLHDLGLVYDALQRHGDARRAFLAAIGEDLPVDYGRFLVVERRDDLDVAVGVPLTEIALHRGNTRCLEDQDALARRDVVPAPKDCRVRPGILLLLR